MRTPCSHTQESGAYTRWVGVTETVLPGLRRRPIRDTVTLSNAPILARFSQQPKDASADARARCEGTEVKATERPRESTIAWDLIDHVREHLTDEERNTAFVALGVDDYPPVFRCVLEVVVRERISLPEEMVGQLRGWLEDYDRHRDFGTILARALGEPSN